MNGMMTGVLLDGTKVGNKRMTLPQAHFHSGSLDVSATIGPKRFEWVNTNLDTGAAVNTFPLNFGPQGAGDGSFYRTASGEWILDGGAGFLTQENADTLPILICRDSRHGSNGSDIS